MRFLAVSFWICSLAAAAVAEPRELCSERLARLRVETPQLAEVRGTHHDTTFVLNTWPQQQNKGEHEDDDPRNHGAYHLAQDIAAHVVAYGRDERHIPYDAKPREGAEYPITWMLTELMNNAAYHGNQGNAALRVVVRVVLAGDVATVRISDFGELFDVSPFSIEPDWAAMWADYSGADAGGDLGVRAILPAFVVKYGFRVVSEGRDDGDGVLRTDVVVTIPLTQALAAGCESK